MDSGIGKSLVETKNFMVSSSSEEGKAWLLRCVHGVLCASGPARHTAKAGGSSAVRTSGTPVLLLNDRILKCSNIELTLSQFNVRT